MSTLPPVAGTGDAAAWKLQPLSDRVYSCQGFLNGRGLFEASRQATVLGLGRVPEVDERPLHVLDRRSARELRGHAVDRRPANLDRPWSPTSCKQGSLRGDDRRRSRRVRTPLKAEAVVSLT